MIYNETVSYLYNLQKYGIKLGLDNIRRLASSLGSPQQSYRCIHVAGTNGKGSTSAMIASILQAAGFKTGLFTSPHLISFTERIRINDTQITEDEVVALVSELRDTISLSKGFSPTFFEVVTAMAMLYFKRKKIDIAVMEVGMGGRLDATNIVSPEVSVITSISMDHEEFLGKTLEEIAEEKAGIIKNSVPVVVSRQDAGPLGVIEKTAEKRSADMYLYGKDFSSELKRKDITGILFRFSGGRSCIMDDMVLPLAGEHQMLNASVALEAAMIALGRCTSYMQSPPCHPLHEFPELSQYLREGLRNVKWSGRLEFVHEDPPILIDGAHNAAAATALSRELKDCFAGMHRRLILILGIMGDKDVPGIMGPLLPLASDIILTAPSYARAARPDTLADIARSLGFPRVTTAPTVKDAIAHAKTMASGAMYDGTSTKGYPENALPLIVITGSFYTIGEAKEVLGQRGVLTGLRE
ncbi:MAG: folylpolyglutamate synthase/dihydrofolate synthase family protein [Nitrospirota bacterium]